MAYELASVSRVGDRARNEDAYTHCGLGRGLLALVADGMGGHAHGDWASTLFCGAMRELAPDYLPAMEQVSLERAQASLADWIEAAARMLRQCVHERDPAARPRTACALVVSTPFATCCAHVGDCRVYLFSSGAQQWRSRDHSIVQMLVDEGEVAEQDMGQHPDQGRLFRSIGVTEAPRPSFKVLAPLGDDDGLLLCSDGFWEYQRPEEMGLLVQSEHLQAALERAAEMAVARAQGRSDNVTALVVRSRKT